MKIKYYSELTQQYYDTEQACLDAENPPVVYKEGTPQEVINLINARYPKWSGLVEWKGAYFYVSNYSLYTNLANSCDFQKTHPLYQTVTPNPLQFKEFYKNLEYARSELLKHNNNNSIISRHAKQANNLRRKIVREDPEIQTLKKQIESLGAQVRKLAASKHAEALKNTPLEKPQPYDKIAVKMWFNVD